MRIIRRPAFCICFVAACRQPVRAFAHTQWPLHASWPASEFLGSSNKNGAQINVYMYIYYYALCTVHGKCDAPIQAAENINGKIFYVLALSFVHHIFRLLFFFAFSQFSVHFIQFANCNGHLNAYLSSVSRLSASRHLCVWFLVVSPILYAPHLYAHSMCDELGRRMLPRSYVYSHNRIWTRKNSTTTSACAKNSEPAADWVVIVEGFYLCSVANDVASLIHVYPTNMKTNTQRSFEWKKKKKKKKEGATTKDAFLRHWVFTAMWFGKRTQRMLWG